MTAVHRQDLEAALGGFAAGRAALAAGIAVESLHGGASNRSVRVSSAAGDWVVRLGGPDDQAFGINRIAERQVHAAAARAGFAPALVHAAPERGLLVSEYVAGRTLAREELRTEAGLRALGARLGQLHALPPPRGVRRLDVHDVLAHYLELRDVAPGPMPRDELAARLRWSLATYRQSAIAFCHNDLHWRNVIAADRLWFVDWEYGGVGDPLFDLAAVVGYHDLDPRSARCCSPPTAAPSSRRRSSRCAASSTACTRCGSTPRAAGARSSRSGARRCSRAWPSIRRSATGEACAAAWADAAAATQSSHGRRASRRRCRFPLVRHRQIAVARRPCCAARSRAETRRRSVEWLSLWSWTAMARNIESRGARGCR
jgi:aminoglycoside phosphotransferase (APT) family kinase protein